MLTLPRLWLSLWESGLPTCLWLLHLTGNSYLGFGQSLGALQGSGKEPLPTHPTPAPLNVSEIPSSQSQRRAFPPGPGGWTMDLHPSLSFGMDLGRAQSGQGRWGPPGPIPSPTAPVPLPPHLPTPAAPAVTAAAKAVARSNVLLAWSKARGGNQRIHLRKRQARAPRDTQSPAGVGVQFVPGPPPHPWCVATGKSTPISPLLADSPLC